MKAVAGRSASRPLLKPTGTRQARATVSSMPHSTSSAAQQRLPLLPHFPGKWVGQGRAREFVKISYTRQTERQWGYATETLHPTDGPARECCR